MGKVYKNKARSCGLCKPHKRGWAKKNTNKVLVILKTTDKDMEEEFIFIKCPDCKGKGFIKTPVKFESFTHYETNECIACNGIGKVEKINLK